MRTVMEMFAFVRSVRSGNWKLHLVALKLFTKYFFAHDENWNWIVNKKGEVPFCRIGGDNALERLSRSMKVSEGLVGITLNASARTKVFSLCSEAYEINS